MKKISLAITGCMGRMGRQLIKSSNSDKIFKLVTITESKKFTNDDGTFHYKKHKIYLYKEDFKDFSIILGEMVNFIIKERGEEVISDRHQKNYDKYKNLDSVEASSNNFTELNFEDI